MLFETKGREEDPQILIRKHTGGGTLQGDASKQLETLYKPEQVDKLNNAKVDVLKLCRQWWEEFKRTTRKDVIEKSDGFKVSGCGCKPSASSHQPSDVVFDCFAVAQEDITS